MMFKGVHIAASIPSRWPLNPSYMHTFGLYSYLYHYVPLVDIYFRYNSKLLHHCRTTSVHFIHWHFGSQMEKWTSSKMSEMVSRWICKRLFIILTFSEQAYSLQQLCNVVLCTNKNFSIFSNAIKISYYTSVDYKLRPPWSLPTRKESRYQRYQNRI